MKKLQNLLKLNFWLVLHHSSTPIYKFFSGRYLLSVSHQRKWLHYSINHLGNLPKKRKKNEWKTNKDLLTLSVLDAGIQIKLENINYGSKTKKDLKKLWEGKRK